MDICNISFKNSLEYMDYAPGVSLGKNLVDVFIKSVWSPDLENISFDARTYYEHITNKSYSDCFVFMIPLGKFYVYLTREPDPQALDEETDQVQESINFSCTVCLSLINDNEMTRAIDYLKGIRNQEFRFHTLEGTVETLLDKGKSKTAATLINTVTFTRFRQVSVFKTIVESLLRNEDTDLAIRLADAFQDQDWKDIAFVRVASKAIEMGNLSLAKMAANLISLNLDNHAPEIDAANGRLLKRSTIFTYLANKELGAAPRVLDRAELSLADSVSALVEPAPETVDEAEESPTLPQETDSIEIKDPSAQIADMPQPEAERAPTGIIIPLAEPDAEKVDDVEESPTPPPQTDSIEIEDPAAEIVDMPQPEAELAIVDTTICLAESDPEAVDEVEESSAPPSEPRLNSRYDEEMDSAIDFVKKGEFEAAMKVLASLPHILDRMGLRQEIFQILKESESSKETEKFIKRIEQDQTTEYLDFQSKHPELEDALVALDR